MRKISFFSWLFCCVFILAVGIFYYPKWQQQQTEATISWDVSGYYMYLPATFIYKDLQQCKFKDSILAKYHPTPDFQQAYEYAPHKFVMKYWVGQSIMFLPFFSIGHWVASISNIYPVDGFSFPYQISIGLGMLLYACLGFWLLRKFLLCFFADKTVAFTLLAIALATNYFNYVAIDGAMVHNSLFLLYALLLNLLVSFYRKLSIKKCLSIGCVIGLMVLIRPTEIIAFILVLGWGITSLSDFKERFKLIKEKWAIASTLLVSFFCIVSIQLFYWRSVTGNWVIDTYHGEHFNFLHPHLYDCLFSYKAGMFVYAPALLLAFVGFVPLFRNYKNLFFVTTVFIFLFLYCCFSWEAWWYGGSLGQRAIIQIYPILALPLAAFIERILQRRIIAKLILYSFLFLCISYNSWVTHEAHKGGLLVAGEMNKKYYWAVLGKFSVAKETAFLLDETDGIDSTSTTKQLIYSNNFNNILLDSTNQFSSEYFFKLPSANLTNIKAKVDCSIFRKEWDTWKMAQFIIHFYSERKIIKTNFIRPHRVLSDNDASTITLTATVPKMKIDSVSVLFWNCGSKEKIQFKNIRVFGF